jgi:hypothetical protein
MPDLTEYKRFHSVEDLKNAWRYGFLEALQMHGVEVEGSKDFDQWYDDSFVPSQRPDTDNEKREWIIESDKGISDVLYTEKEALEIVIKTGGTAFKKK